MSQDPRAQRIAYEIVTRRGEYIESKGDIVWYLDEENISEEWLYDAAFALLMKHYGF